MQNDWQYHYVECDCRDDAHLFKLVYVPGDNYGVGNVCLSVQMNQYLPWYKRVWQALRYVFGAESRFGHWDTTCMEPDRVQALHSFTGRCLVEMQKDPRYKEMYPG